MVNLSDVVGMMFKEGMSGSSSNRLKHALQSEGSPGGGIGDLLGGLTGGGGVGKIIGNLLGRGGTAGGGFDGFGKMLGGILGDADRSLRGRQNLALGGLSAFAGDVLGGDSRMPSSGKSSGSGAMALLGAMAFKALKGSRTAPAPAVPLGLREPEDGDEREQLETNAGWMLKAMISAAKSDGAIDPKEMERILGKMSAEGLDEETRQMVMEEMAQPLDLPNLCAKAKSQQELAAQMYAASLMAIEVDTPAEEDYMRRLADGLNLTPGTVQRLQTMLGMRT